VRQVEDVVKDAKASARPGRITGGGSMLRTAQADDDGGDRRGHPLGGGIEAKKSSVAIAMQRSLKSHDGNGLR